MDLNSFLCDDLLLNFHQQILDLMLAERNRQITNYLKVQDLFSSHQNRLVNQHDQIVQKLQQDHDKEINNKHTVALKIALIKEYDEKNAILEREIAYLKAQLHKKTSSFPTNHSTSAPSNSTESESEITDLRTTRDTLLNNHETKQLTDNQSKINDSLTLPRNDGLAPQINGGVSSPINDGQETSSKNKIESIQRKKIKWKDVWYYYDTTSMNVYTDLTSQVPIGQKIDKKLVMK